MKKVKKPLVGVIMGSDSDWPVVENACAMLEALGVPCEVRVISAHRTPEKAANYAREAEGRGLKVLIAAAGQAAHLAGALSAHTILPVIGIPVKGGALDGLDALLSTVQMPGGIPVATVALGSAGAVNAAILAAQMLALNDAALRKKLREHKDNLKSKAERADRLMQERVSKGAKKI